MRDNLQNRSPQAFGRRLISILLLLVSWTAFGGPPLELGNASPPAKGAGAPGSYHLYLPLVMRPPAAPADLEITQSVQQPGNPVTLVANRPTFVRYTLTDPSAHSGVEALLYGSRGGTSLPGSPIAAINNPRTLESSADRSSLNDTFNFNLPTSWISGTVQLWTSASNGTGYSVQGGPRTVAFLSNDPLPIRVLPIAYTCTSGGSGTTTPSGPFTYLDDVAFKLYPVPSTDLDVHAPVSYSGPCINGQPNPSYDGGDWDSMLHAVRDVWSAEGQPNRYYYGLVNSYCGGSCIAGLGYVGWYKAAVGWNGGGQSDASSTHAHELGHNHGLPHAPGCGAGNPDPNYPYAGGLIGDSGHPNYGYDILSGSLKVFSSYYDIMTYCGSKWISDYNYEGLYDFEQAQAAIQSPNPVQDSLLVTGSIDDDGTVRLQPAFRLGIPASEPRPGTFKLELLDSAGAVLSSTDFEPITAAADGIGGAQGGQEQSFTLTIPYVAGVEVIRVVQAGAPLTEIRADQFALDRPIGPIQAQLHAGYLLASWSGAPGASYLVRLSSDEGDHWQVIGVNLTQPRIDLPISEGADYLLEILASDGVHTKRVLVRPDVTLP